MAGPITDPGPPGVAAMVRKAGEIITEALAPKTRDSYNRIFNEYQVFVASLGFSSILLDNPGAVILYLTSLFQKGLASNTLFSRASALAYILKLRGDSDPTQHFLVKKFLKGAKHARPSADIRQPMSVQILELFNTSIVQQCYTSYYQLLFKCMFNVAK